MLAVVFSVAAALLPHHVSTQAVPHQAATFPMSGIVVAGTSLGGIKIGDTPARVQMLWGKRYQLCDAGTCPLQTWLYEQAKGEPLGVGVSFVKGKVAAVFTLGSPDGWKTDRGLRMGDEESQVYTYYPTPFTTNCIGYDALSVRNQQTKIVTSIYASSGYVYGFAITAPGQPVCV
jgi:hypothetical protein